MYDILLNSQNEEHNFDTFYHRFLSICEEHKQNERAMAFAFILYDFTNPQISKILKDSDYWLSLNEASGRYLTVFSLHYKPEPTYNEFEHDSHSMGFMTSFTSSSNPSQNSNKLIEEYFGRELEVKYPAVLFFQTNSDEIIDYTLIELDERGIEQAFEELQNYIDKAVDALKLITDENKNNFKEIFSNLETRVTNTRTRKVASRNLKKGKAIVELGATIFGLF